MTFEGIRKYNRLDTGSLDPLKIKALDSSVMSKLFVERAWMGGSHGIDSPIGVDQATFGMNDRERVQIDDSSYQKNIELPQTYFQDQTGLIAVEIVGRIRGAVARNEVISEFIPLLEDLGRKRRDLAETQESRYKERFGRLRVADEDIIQITSSWDTPLCEQYTDYGMKIKHVLNELMKEVIDSDSKRVIESTEVNGFTTRSTIRKMKSNGYSLDIKLIHEGKEDSLSGLSMLKYNSFIPTFSHSTLDQLPSIKALLADIFKACLDSDSLTSLQKNIAIFRYLFAHACPYERGSAAVSEWIEKAIYLYKGYEVQYPEGYRIDLEAMTSLDLSEFVKDYMLNVTQNP